MTQTPKDMLKSRLATGAISIEEYRQLLAEISDESDSLIKERNSNQNGSGLDAGILLGEFEDLKLFENCIAYKGCEYALSDVTSVRGGQSSRSFNLVPTEKSSSLSVFFVSGNTVRLSENRILFGNKRHEAIGRILSLLRNITFNHRMTNLVKKLALNGQIELYKPIVGSGESVVLRKDGMVVTTSISINLKQAKATGTFGLGSEWRSLNYVNHETNPYEVILSDKRGTFGALIPRGALRFVPYIEDVDIVHALLAWMAEPGNQLTK
jgi:hypothetical protein